MSADYTKDEFLAARGPSAARALEQAKASALARAKPEQICGWYGHSWGPLVPVTGPLTQTAITPHVPDDRILAGHTCQRCDKWELVL